MGSSTTSSDGGEERVANDLPARAESHSPFKAADVVGAVAAVLSPLPLKSYRLDIAVAVDHVDTVLEKSSSYDFFYSDIVNFAIEHVGFANNERYVRTQATEDEGIYGATKA